MSKLTAAENLHRLAEYEAAYNARRARLAAEVDAATLAGRVFTAISTARNAAPQPAQPTMRWFVDAGQRPYRSQPRDGRGRFLSKAWLAEAELFTAQDRAWFRGPITSSQEGK